MGGIALLLALFAMHLLPVNLAGICLIAFALALFVLEAKFPTHGILGVGGMVSMTLGALMLIRSPAHRQGCELGHCPGVAHSLRHHHHFPDAAGPAVAQLEAQHRQGRIDRRRRSGYRAIGPRPPPAWFSCTASCGAPLPSNGEAIPKGARVRVKKSGGAYAGGRAGSVAALGGVSGNACSIGGFCMSKGAIQAFRRSVRSPVAR